MLQLPTKKIAAIARWSALIAAFTICLAVIAFSWPDPHERRRVAGPQVAGCCNSGVVKSVLVSGSIEAKREQAGYSATPENR
jgi:hypothetical protein